MMLSSLRAAQRIRCRSLSSDLLENRGPSSIVISVAEEACSSAVLSL